MIVSLLPSAKHQNLPQSRARNVLHGKHQKRTQAAKASCSGCASQRCLASLLPLLFACCRCATGGIANNSGGFVVVASLALTVRRCGLSPFRRSSVLLWLRKPKMSCFARLLPKRSDSRERWPLRCGGAGYRPSGAPRSCFNAQSRKSVLRSRWLCLFARAKIGPGKVKAIAARCR